MATAPSTTKFDVLVLGATGSAGRWVVRYLSEREGSFTWAVAARSRAKIENLIAETREWRLTSRARGGSFPLSDREKVEEDGWIVPGIIVDVTDDESLREACQSAKSVINCVGPFRFFGDAIVRICAETQTHYVDISGEPEFIEGACLRYFQQCQENGTFVVSACGFDSIPSDIGQLFLELYFKENGWLCHSVECYVTQELPPGYTVNSTTFKAALHGFSSVKSLKKVRSDLTKCDFRDSRKELKRAGPKQVVYGSGRGGDDKWPVFWSDVVAKYCTIFPFADSAVVAHSQGLSQAALCDSMSRSDSKAIERVFPQFAVYLTFSSTLEMVQSVCMGVCMKTLGAIPSVRSLMIKYPYIASFGLFTDGGPTDDQIEGAEFQSSLIGFGYDKSGAGAKASADGDDSTDDSKMVDDSEDVGDDKRVKLTVSGPDAGYKGTAMMIAESALCLLDEMDAIRKGDSKRQLPAYDGGVFTPSAVFANTKLINRLERAGITFTVQDYE